MGQSAVSSALKARQLAPVSRQLVVAVLAIAAIGMSLAQRLAGVARGTADLPLLVVLAAGAVFLVPALVWNALHARFGSDQLAGISIVASVMLHEYLAGAIVVLMLSGGETLEAFVVARATGALRALASRVPTLAHRVRNGTIEEIAVADVRAGDELVVLPYEVCPVDGNVTQGHGAMDESYLTGEPFTIPKGPGATVISGAVNGESRLMIRATRVAADSRYARIMRVMHEAEQRRPALRRVGDQLGAWYTPLALVIAVAAWAQTGNPMRFLSVVVVATPCPLLIAIPVAIIGAIWSAARRGMIVRDPGALEQLTLCRTMILDKTGTLTYGRPVLSEELYAPGFSRDALLPSLGAMEQYSRHPVARAIVEAAERAGCRLPDVDWIREEPGVGLHGHVQAMHVLLTGRAQATGMFDDLPAAAPTGLECIVIVNGAWAAAYRFHDVARVDSGSFIAHLGPNHGMSRVLLVSGDREAEVRRLADAVGIGNVHSETSPEEKVAIVRRENAAAKTVFIGDGINDAPALASATVGIAFGRHSDVTSEAARVVIIDSSLSKVDELMHISFRLRRVALQSALGGMLLSVVGMILAAFGLLLPVEGAIAQEAIDLLAVLNALRTARPVRTDFVSGGAEAGPTGAECRSTLAEARRPVRF